MGYTVNLPSRESKYPLCQDIFFIPIWHFSPKRIYALLGYSVQGNSIKPKIKIKDLEL
jgi:hypothetical protein